MITTKIGRRGQVTIPSRIRQKVGLSEGDAIAFISQGDHILIKPLPQTLLDLRGSIQVSEPQDFNAIRQVVRSHHTQSEG